MKTQHVKVARGCTCEAYPFCEHAPNAVKTQEKAHITPGPMLRAAKQYVHQCPMCNSGQECQDDLCFEFRRALETSAQAIAAVPDLIAASEHELDRVGGSGGETVNYKAGDRVLIHYRRGAKLAEIIGPSAFHRGEYVVKIWKASSQRWTRAIRRSADEIFGRASESDLRCWRFPEAKP
jgi:hypothetical protein